MFTELVLDALKITLLEQVFKSLQETLHIPHIEQHLNPSFHNKKNYYFQYF